MIKEIGSFRFPGFYESLFYNSDEFIEDETELENEIKKLISTTDIEVSYEYENFDEYKKNVCKTFMEYYVDKIHEVLPDDIINHEDFKFDIVDKKENIVIISPKYYNYGTDRCFCDIETNRKTLKLIKEYTLRLKSVEKYLLNNFTSYDGFISFISNDIDVWKSLDIEDYEENMLIALLDMLIQLSDDDAFDEITENTFYDIDKYEYASPVVYYRGNNKKDIKILKKNGFSGNF